MQFPLLWICYLTKLYSLLKNNMGSEHRVPVDVIVDFNIPIKRTINWGIIYFLFETKPHEGGLKSGAWQLVKFASIPTFKAASRRESEDTVNHQILSSLVETNPWFPFVPGQLCRTLLEIVKTHDGGALLLQGRRPMEKKQTLLSCYRLSLYIYIYIFFFNCI